MQQSQKKQGMALCGTNRLGRVASQAFFQTITAGSDFYSTQSGPIDGLSTLKNHQNGGIAM